MQLGEGGQLGGVNRADEPEPRNADDGGIEFALGKGFFQQVFGAAGDVGVDAGVRVFRRYFGHQYAAHQADNGNQ